MNLQCSTTADAITSVLLAGDAVLNLTGHALNTIAGTAFVSDSGEGLKISFDDSRVVWRPSHGPALRPLISRDITRIVVVTEDDFQSAEAVMDVLRSQKIPHCHCVLANECSSDAFMDPEDAEAVAERLRQLGYL